MRFAVITLFGRFFSSGAVISEMILGRAQVSDVLICFYATVLDR